MSAPRRTPAKREADRETIARMLLRKEPNWKIAKAVDLSPAMVTYERKHLYRLWQARAMEHVEEHISRELALLDEVEREAWGAWQRSLEETRRHVQIRKTLAGEAGEEHIQRVETALSIGDPRYLEIVLRSSVERRKLLGLDQPLKIDIETRIRELAREEGIDEEEAVAEAQRLVARLK